MNFRLLAVVTATSFTALMGAANAASNRVADKVMDTCIRQFVADNLSGYDGKVAIRKDTSGHRPLLGGQTHYQISVAAADRATGTHLAGITCQVNRDGKIISTKAISVTSSKLVQRIKPAVAKNAAG
ncbi:MAG: hypothetical protein H7Y02_00985 [Candidatus Obscuribacterales bacterium]|nr:hypothetical protein [Steroidobacteraceae bacterium]